ncbi:XAP5 protein [Corchorus capsularis]|uniref:XAP5 protein n=1 Tax=Corchorus capsularis TaxID=210143 RepID=A0A1R3H5P0_COCAP|nr:XAP5 protein [Corchorus capsularis]
MVASQLTSFYEDSVVGELDLTFELSDEDDLSVNGRQKSKLRMKDCGNNGFVNTSKSRVHKGDTIEEFLRAVQRQLAPEFREIRTTSVENLLYVKESLIISQFSNVAPTS